MNQTREREPNMSLGETSDHFVVALQDPQDRRTEVFKILFTFSESLRVLRGGKLVFLFDKSLFAYNGKSERENFHKQAAEIAEIGGVPAPGEPVALVEY